VNAVPKQEDEQKEDALMDIHGIIGEGEGLCCRFDSTHPAGVGMLVASSQEECLNETVEQFEVVARITFLLSYLLSHLPLLNAFQDHRLCFPLQLKRHARSTGHLESTPLILAQVVQ
jgi:hypothetical protein